MVAVTKWKNVVGQELTVWQERLEVKENVHEYDWDNIADEAYIMKKTERLMYANIAVSLFAIAENFIRILCLNLEGTKVQGKVKAINRPTWGNLRQVLDQECGIDYETIKQFNVMDRVRILNNCFKHNSGEPNDEYVQKYGGDYIKEIEYEKKDWDTMISECETFLLNLANQARDAVKRELNI